MVHYVPPQECVGPKSLTLYPAIVVQVNQTPFQDAPEQTYETVELATFGPNSLYFQHTVPFAEEYTPGHWSWMPFQKDQQARLAKEK